MFPLLNFGSRSVLIRRPIAANGGLPLRKPLRVPQDLSGKTPGVLAQSFVMTPKTSRGFRVAHQKVHADVDLYNQVIHGHTELTVVPVTSELREVTLDARQLVVKSVTINGQPVEYVHSDSLATKPARIKDWTESQHHMLRDHHKSLFQSGATNELVVQIPEDIQIKEQDVTSTFIVSHAPEEKACEPLTLKIFYEVSGPVAGFNFVGGKGSSLPRTDWQGYTTQAFLGQSASTWMPCVDGLLELCTWEIEVAVPKTLGDLDPESRAQEDEQDDEDSQRDIVVVANNNQPAQVVHPTDSYKKVVSFEIFTPVAAHHVGFALGPFVQVPITQITEEGDDSGSSSVPFSVYTIKRNAAMALHTCGIFPKAMDFFTRDFGSFPFTSYSICFVSDLVEQSADAIGLSIISDALLFPENVIEPLFQNTEPLISCLAAQWCGVSISPLSINDLWVTQGIAMYMTHLFIQKLMGNNEYRFRMRKYVDEITHQDINMPPLANPEFKCPIRQSDLEFIRLKAPMVLYILDRRMTKTDRSLGLSRVITKLFLQSMSGDLHAQVSTAHFIKLCERVAHHRLTAFFQEWVHGSGYPIFRVTQRFNKKRMFIEMGIGQVHSREMPPELLQNETFLSQALRDLDHAPEGASFTPVPAFTGPMTIRIHEADGTPYEHVVDLKDSFTKLEIQYNTKYKRLKRNQRYRGGRDDEDEGQPTYINCLGDVLMRDQEIREWRLSDWGQEDEDYMFNEAFEWIRVDSDFEWICKMYVGQPDYMFASQLQQDRDVVAQYEAVVYFSSQSANPIHSSILLRTLIDRRYFYGLRILAAFGVANHAVDKANFIGKFHLMKAFQALFCFPRSFVPRANDFRDFASYFVQKAIPVALSTIRDNGRCPKDVCEMLYDLTRYNENSGNIYSDGYYVSTLITAVVNALKSPTPDTPLLDLDNPLIQDYVQRVTAEIDKCQRLDRWQPSYKQVVTTTSLAQYEALILEGYGVPKIDKLIALSSPANSVEVRLAAFSCLLNMGAYRRKEVCEYVVATCAEDASAQIRVGVLRALTAAIGHVAIHGEYLTRDSKTKIDMMEERKRRGARKSVHTAVPLLRRTLEPYPLASVLWQGLLAYQLNLDEKRRVLDILKLLVEPKSRLIVTMPTPKLFRLSAKRKQDFLMVVKYRSVLRQEKKRSSAPMITLPSFQERKPPALKLKLGVGAVKMETE